MRIAGWKTGHAIADTVAEVIYQTLKLERRDVTMLQATARNIGYVGLFDAHIAYGILRGTDAVFHAADVQGKPWIHLDRGYFHPSHFNGYYRISLRGTQQTTGLDQLEPDYNRLKALNLDIKPWRGFDESKPVLVCPPTEAVMDFFGMAGWPLNMPDNIIMRTKGDPTPINFNDYSYVLTFNSSVGWQALQAGIPCISDPTHSIVGAWFNKHGIDDLSFSQQNEREKLFSIMAGLQLTLDEMRSGKIWEVLQCLIFISGMTAASPNAPTFSRTAFQSGLKPIST